MPRLLTSGLSTWGVAKDRSMFHAFLGRELPRRSGGQGGSIYHHLNPKIFGPLFSTVPFYC
jgi:hypothetical protein